MRNSKLYYKVFTHDLCSPIQGGTPVWDGRLPITLPTVPVDASDKECGAGWNFCSEAWIALKIAKFWPNGHSARVFTVSPESTVYQRKEKARSASISIVKELTQSEIASAIQQFSESLLSPFALEMTAEQVLWFEALKRPYRDESAVKAALQTVWPKPQCARDARDAWNAWGVWGAWGARGAWNAWNAWDAWNAWNAWNALTEYFSVLNGWLKPASINRAAIREAYKNGAKLVRFNGTDTPVYEMVP